MTEKKGLFGFFKGWSSVTEEEKQQNAHAQSQGQGATAVQTVTKEQECIVTDEIETFAVEKCEEMLGLAGFSGKVRCKKKMGYTLYIEVFDAGDDLGRIIGRNGTALQAIQMLIKFFIIRQFEVSIKVVLDAGDYTSRYQSQLKKKALIAADDVIQSGESVSLEPMNALDRRFVHVLFETSHEVSTISEGEGRDRYVVIVKKD